MTDSRILICTPDSLKDLPLTIYKLTSSQFYKRVIRLDMSAGIQFQKNFYDLLFSACTDSLMTFWKNRITLTRFGRRYSRNLFENLHYLAETKAITDFFKSVDRPIIVFGAGESTQTFIDNGLLRRCAPRNDGKLPYYILCADTALQPLLKNGIKPDGVFVEEAQSVIAKAFTGSPSGIRIFAGLSSIPNIVHKVGASNLSYFFTEYAQGSFFDFLKSQDFMPPVNKPFGSVGLTAVFYALKFRRDESIPVYVTGLDFSYSSGLTHTKGALANIIRLISASRIQPPQNYAAAFGLGTEKISGKNGRPFITTPTLKSYASMFRSFFAGQPNLFDAGESGIDLGLPHITIDCFVANAPRNDNNSQNPRNDAKKAKDRSNPYTKEIETFLKNEAKALEYLRKLLTGKTELKDDKLLEEVRKIAEVREYLYLHFPDGYKFNTRQSFLNRIRTEIDYFLKFL